MNNNSNIINDWLNNEQVLMSLLITKRIQYLDKVWDRMALISIAPSSTFYVRGAAEVEEVIRAQSVQSIFCERETNGWLYFHSWVCAKDTSSSTTSFEVCWSSTLAA